MPIGRAGGGVHGPATRAGIRANPPREARHGDARYGDARYGEFPHLFWDLAPDAPVDVGDAVVLTRLLARGRPEDVRRLIALADLEPRLPVLPLPAAVRRFWTRVVTGRVATDDGSGARATDRAPTDA